MKKGWIDPLDFVSSPATTYDLIHVAEVPDSAIRAEGKVVTGGIRFHVGKDLPLSLSGKIVKMLIWEE